MGLRVFCKVPFQKSNRLEEESRTLPFQKTGFEDSEGPIFFEEQGLEASFVPQAGSKSLLEEVEEIDKFKNVFCKVPSQKSNCLEEESRTLPLQETGFEDSAGPFFLEEQGLEVATVPQAGSKSLLEEVEEIDRSKNLGLKVFCNVPFQESNDAMYISFLGEKPENQTWFKYKHAGHLPLIIVRKNSIILMDEFQECGNIDDQFNKLEAAKQIISDLLRIVFEYNIPGYTILKAFYCPECDLSELRNNCIFAHFLSELQIQFVTTSSQLSGEKDSEIPTVTLEDLLCSEQDHKPTENAEIHQDVAIAGIVSLYFQSSYEKCKDHFLEEQLADFKMEFDIVDSMLVQFSKTSTFLASKETSFQKLTNLMMHGLKSLTKDEKENFLSKVALAVFTSYNADPPNENWMPAVKALISEEVKVHQQKLDLKYGILTRGK